MTNPPDPGRPLVLGLGNVLMGDEGIGILAARRLAENGDLTARADVVDGGTGGFQLLGMFQDHPRLILVDAAMDGRPPGTVTLLRPRFASDFPKSLSAHDIGLRDLIEAAAMLGPLPPIDLVTVSITDLQSVSLDVSLPVRAALPEIEALVRRLLDRAGGSRTEPES
ncbi:MAG: hydrogenase maturation protease [Candidatus Aminicenantales bacterium]